MDRISFGLDVIKRGCMYSWKHPHLLLLAINQLAKQRLLIPLDSLRFMVKKFLPPSVPIKKLQIKPQPPGLRVLATVEVMGGLIHVEVSLQIQEVSLSELGGFVTVTIQDLIVQASPDSPIAPMLEMVDLKKPGLLIEWLPSLPSFIYKISEDNVILDLWKLPVVLSRPWLGRTLQKLSKAVSIREIRVGNQVVLVHFKIIKSQLLKLLNSVICKPRQISS